MRVYVLECQEGAKSVKLNMTDLNVDWPDPLIKTFNQVEYWLRGLISHTS